MNSPDNQNLLALLAMLSYTSDFSVGCCCEDEAHCRRPVLRELLVEKNASFA
jgi:uncharacterized protein YeaO (DUF488 family)